MKSTKAANEKQDFLPKKKTLRKTVSFRDKSTLCPKYKLAGAAQRSVTRIHETIHLNQSNNSAGATEAFPEQQVYKRKRQQTHKLQNYFGGDSGGGKALKTSPGGGIVSRRYRYRIDHCTSLAIAPLHY